MKYDNKAFLFDLDGVIIDSEPCYDQFWNNAVQKYRVPIENFPAIIKGNTLKAILEKYFYDYPVEIQQQIKQECSDFEQTMDYPPIPGALTFIGQLKGSGYPIALVTSSDSKKVESVISRLKLENFFDSIVTADRISVGKPHPECYLLAAQDLKKEPSDCIVFEDSFTGLEAARRAHMKIVALSTTNPPEQLQGKANLVIPNFDGVQIQSIVSQVYRS